MTHLDRTSKPSACGLTPTRQTATSAKMAHMHSTDVLDDLLTTGEVVIDDGGRAVCARCGLTLGPVAAVGLVVERAIAHLLAPQTEP